MHLSLPAPGQEWELSPEHSHYLTRVLRLGSGDRFLAFDGSGREVVAELRRSGSRTVAAWMDQSYPATESRRRLELYLGLTKGERFERALERATELGVASLTPVCCRRSAVRTPGASRRQRWQQIVSSAAAQCGRVKVPDVRDPVTYEAALEAAASPILFQPGAPPPGQPPEGPLSILIGPEGGFSPEEVDAARLRGAVLVGLGARTLRVETAVSAALALLLDRCGEFEPIRQEADDRSRRSGR